jgi:hypothetical protein
MQSFIVQEILAFIFLTKCDNSIMIFTEKFQMFILQKILV